MAGDHRGCLLWLVIEAPVEIVTIDPDRFMFSAFTVIFFMPSAGSQRP